MIWILLLLFLVSTRASESARVSRIKQPFFNQGAEGNYWFPTPRSEVQQPQSNVDVEHHKRNYPASVDVMTIQQVPPTATTSPKLCHRPYSCVNCTTYRLCVPTSHGFEELFTGLCPTDRPYCDDYSGTCVNSVAVAVKCASPDLTFHCMKDGHFPHLSDPTRYFICSDLKAYGYSCREGYKYYAPARGCSKFHWIANSFDCSGQNATKVVHSSGGSFFAYCVNGKPHLTSSCNENEFFNVTSQVCELQCTEELVAPDSNSCVKYYMCKKNNASQLYEKLSLSCPSGEGFSTTLKKCISLKQLTSCLEN